MIRVATQELINDRKIRVWDGFVVVADLVATINKIFPTLLCVEQVAVIINPYGAQFFQICFLGKCFAIKDRAPLSVLLAYQQIMVQSTGHAPAPSPPGGEQTGGVPLVISYQHRLGQTLRIGFKY